MRALDKKCSSNMIDLKMKDGLLNKTGQNLEKIYAENLSKIEEFRLDMKDILQDWIEEVVSELQSSYEENI